MASSYQRKNIELAEEWAGVLSEASGKDLGYEREHWDCMPVKIGDGAESFVFTPENPENENQYVSAKLEDIQPLSRWR